MNLIKFRLGRILREDLTEAEISFPIALLTLFLWDLWNFLLVPATMWILKPIFLEEEDLPLWRDNLILTKKR
uniref:Uncharacterized protein n=1 Tax=Bacteriophage sp. TaxID=38018 RepID=A0A7G9A4L0_9VIRU|nr:MAG: hypothetical protein [Bacteriophage sp.]